MSTHASDRRELVETQMLMTKTIWFYPISKNDKKFSTAAKPDH